jgi:chromosome segregation ATPase
VQLSAAEVPVARLTSSVGTFSGRTASLSHDLAWATAVITDLAPRAATLQNRIRADRAAITADTGTTQQRFTAYNRAPQGQRAAALAALQTAGDRLAAAQAALKADASAYSAVLSQLLAARQTVAWDTPLLAAAQASEASCRTRLQAATASADAIGRALTAAREQVAALTRAVADAKERLRRQPVAPDQPIIV